MSSLRNSMFHKREKRRNYAMEFKRKATKYPEENSNQKAAEKFHVAVKRIRERRQNKLKTFEPTVKPKNKRLEGCGRKPLDLQLENQLNGFITRYSMEFVSQGNLSWPRRNIFTKGNVMKVRNFCMFLYILHARSLSIKYKYPPSSIIAMDETSVWNDMVSNTTIDKQGAKSVCLKTTVH